MSHDVATCLNSTRLGAWAVSSTPRPPTHGLVQYHLDTFISAIQVMLGKNEKLSSSWLVEYTTEGMPIVHKLSSSIRLFSPIAPWHLQHCATSTPNILPSAGPKKMYKTIKQEALIQFDHLWSPISINFVYLVLNHSFWHSNRHATHHTSHFSLGFPNPLETSSRAAVAHPSHRFERPQIHPSHPLVGKSPRSPMARHP